MQQRDPPFCEVRSKEQLEGDGHWLSRCGGFLGPQCRAAGCGSQGQLMFSTPGLDDFVKDAAKGTPGSGCRLEPKFPSNLKNLEFST